MGVIAMLKRLEVYADTGLLAFVLSVVAVLVFSVLGRLVGMLVGGEAAMIPMMIGVVVLSIATGAVLAIWLARVLHRHVVSEPMTNAESRGVAWLGLAAAIVASLLAAAYVTVGTTTAIAWLGVAAALLVLAVALVVDAVVDLVKPREHIAVDVIRIVLIALLAVSLATSMIQAAPLGSDQDVSPWVVWATVAMIVEALLAFGYDEVASWRSRSRDVHRFVSPAA